ncbi:MAG: caspase family protein, partial [Ignavibacteriaceae bacterium]
ISLQKIFGQIRQSDCEKFVLLLDTCHSGLEIDENMRDITSLMTQDELEEFFKKSEYYVGFASCKTDEISHSASALSHGIWSYHLLQALNGEVPKVLLKDKFITATNLQNYLSIQVPKTAKRYTKTGYQTPIMFGNLSKEFVIADIKKY